MAYAQDKEINSLGKDMIKKENYIFSADVIRVLAILGVIAIHTVNAIYTRLDFLGGSSWWISIIIDSLSRISIPLFIMLSGYLLLRKEETVEMSLKRIFSRILFPFLFGVILYAWWSNGKMLIGNLNLSLIQKIYIIDVNELYFLVIMIGLYLIAPFIKSYLQKATQQQQDFLMKLLLVFGSSEIFLEFLYTRCASDNFFSRWIPYVGLFVAGYVLGNKQIQSKKTLLASIYGVGLLGTILLNYLYYTLSSHNIYLLSTKGCLSHYFDHYLSINVVSMAIPAFLLLLNLSFAFLQNNQRISVFIHSVARASFGIYILHLFILRWLEIQFHLAVDFTRLSLPLVIFLRLILAFVLSYISTLILSKIPVVKYLVGYNK